jgi:hypothetical protein
MRILVFLFLLLITGCTTANHRCRSVDQDISLIVTCERSNSCLYNYKDLKELTYRVAQCAYEDPKKAK